MLINCHVPGYDSCCVPRFAAQLLNGQLTVDFIRASQTDMLHRVVVITAVSNSTLETLRDQHLLCRIVRKPFDLDELIGAVNACTSAITGASGHVVSQ